MSEAAELWLSSQDRPFGQGPGMPHWCVKYVPCPHCGAKPGELCSGKQGPWISHHWMRAKEYTQAKRAGKVPPPPRDDRDAEVLRLTELALEQVREAETVRSAGHSVTLALVATTNLAKAVELLVRGRV